MKSHIAIALIAGVFLTGAAALPPAAGGPAFPREVTITAIPGVVAAGAKWEIAWSGLDDGDGVIATADGGIMFTQAEVSRVRKINPAGNTEIAFEDTGGAGTIGFDSQGRILAATRPPHSHLAELYPERKMLIDNTDGDPFTGAGDMVVDSKGGVYFNESRRMPSPRGHYLRRDGKLFTFGVGLDINGIMLSPDEKTLYVTNRTKLAAFDIQPDGSATNQRDFATLQGDRVAGDGMAVDAAGRLYVSSQYGVQVVSPQGQFLGLIPTPRPCMSIDFSGPDKKTMFITARGMRDANGVEHAMNPARTIYKLQMEAQGFLGRYK